MSASICRTSDTRLNSVAFLADCRADRQRKQKSYRDQRARPHRLDLDTRITFRSTIACLRNQSQRLSICGARSRCERFLRFALVRPKVSSSESSRCKNPKRRLWSSGAAILPYDLFLLLRSKKRLSVDECAGTGLPHTKIVRQA